MSEAPLKTAPPWPDKAFSKAPSLAPDQSVGEHLHQSLNAYRAIGSDGETRRHSLARRALSAACAELDLEALERLRRRQEGQLVEGRRWLSYFALGDHLVRLAGVAVKLDLDRRPETRILDLGAGSGLFAYLCARVLGHEVVGLELPADERPVNTALCELLGVGIVEGRLGPRRPLPPLDGRFGLVTALSPQFHRVDRTRFWSPDEWAWFLDHLAERASGPDGAFYLKINRDKRIKGGLYRHADFFDFARSRGAAVEEKTGIVRFERLSPD